jgi:hypothetical protein
VISFSSWSYNGPTENSEICKINVRTKRTLQFPLNTLIRDSRGCSCYTGARVKIKKDKENEQIMKKEEKSKFGDWIKMSG